MFDCIIVGAGPAGGTAAYHLAKRGRSVVVLEKESLPRYKPCGGGVSPIVQQWFDFDFSPAVSVKANEIRYTWKMGDPVDVKLEKNESVWMVRQGCFRPLFSQASAKTGC
jgi:flavin-dependent dehydrogenase